jgi:hypothetical protein
VVVLILVLLLPRSRGLNVPEISGGGSRALYTAAAIDGRTPTIRT